MATPDAVDRPAQLDADGAAAAAAGPSAAGQVELTQPNLSQEVKAAQKAALADDGRRSDAWNELDRRAMLKAGVADPESRSGGSSDASRSSSGCRFSFGGSATGKGFFGRVSSSHPKVSATSQSAPASSAAGANGPVRRRAAPTQPSSAA
eukprot:scaffold62472_cov69-Phaeocystis_antarctica.AAC.1